MHQIDLPVADEPSELTNDLTATSEPGTMEASTSMRPVSLDRISASAARALSEISGAFSRRRLALLLAAAFLAAAFLASTMALSYHLPVCWSALTSA